MKLLILPLASTVKQQFCQYKVRSLLVTLMLPSFKIWTQHLSGFINICAWCSWLHLVVAYASVSFVLSMWAFLFTYHAIMRVFTSSGDPRGRGTWPGWAQAATEVSLTYSFLWQHYPTGLHRRKGDFTHTTNIQGPLPEADMNNGNWLYLRTPTPPDLLMPPAKLG